MNADSVGQTCSPYIAIPAPEIIAIAVLGWGCEPDSWGRGGRRGSGMVPFERALVSSYKTSIVTFHLSLRISALVSLKFPHVSLGVGGWSLGCKERRCWVNCPCN